MVDTYEIDVFELDTTCDELFGLVDTAKHNGFHRTDAELCEHIQGGRECCDVNGEVLA